MPITDITDMVVDEGMKMYDRAHEIDTATQEVEKGFLDDEYEGIRDDEPPPPTDADYS